MATAAAFPGRGERDAILSVMVGPAPAIAPLTVVHRNRREYSGELPSWLYNRRCADGRGKPGHDREICIS